MTYQVLEKQIKQMPPQYIIEVSKYIDYLLSTKKKEQKQQKRELGFLSGIADVTFADDFEMTAEELLAL